MSPRGLLIAEGSWVRVGKELCRRVGPVNSSAVPSRRLLSDLSTSCLVRVASKGRVGSSASPKELLREPGADLGLLLGKA